jgi:hypothetical protein
VRRDVIDLAIAESPSASRRQASRASLTRLLAELESLILGIRTDVYAAARGDRGSTIGDAVAASLARLDALIAARGAQTIRYSAPAASVAADPVAALRKIRALRAAAAGWPRAALTSRVRVEHAGSPSEDFEIGWSTLAAEAAFVVSETIAAQQSMVALLARLGLSAPEGFGTMPLPALAARSSTPPTWPLWQRLDQIAALLLEMPASVYTAPVATHVSGTVGEHVRHCLDHVSALLSSDASSTLSYDLRRRGTAVESDPGAALQQILRLKAALDRWSTRSLDEPIRVSSLIDASGASIAGWSTLGRELVFVLSHTIHHQATMAALLALHGVAAPEGFGYAPSTPQRA